MMKIGSKVKGISYDNDCNEVEVVGIYEFRTNDPEEYQQAIGIRTGSGQLFYCDEGTVRPVKS
jgi:hypothetical protein